jgi:hypothetical protein
MSRDADAATARDRSTRSKVATGDMWCTNPAGERYRKYVKAKTYEEVQRAWLKLRDEASRGPVASDVPTLEKFLRYWLEDIARPNAARCLHGGSAASFCASGWSLAAMSLRSLERRFTPRIS